MTDTRNRGFAIIVVLAALLILTALFAISSARSMAHIQTQNAEQYLAANNSQRVTLLRLATTIVPSDAVTGAISLPPPFHTQTLRLQDVGGFIDLNTASPEILEKLFRHLRFPNDAQSKFRSWRREGQRLMRVDDLIRITSADPALRVELAQVATVFSGRRGIAIEHAPAKVLEIVRDGGNAINESDISPASNINFRVYLQNTDNEQMIGVVSIFGGTGQSRILEVR